MFILIVSSLEVGSEDKLDTVRPDFSFEGDF